MTSKKQQNIATQRLKFAKDVEVNLKRIDESIRALLRKVKRVKQEPSNSVEISVHAVNIVDGAKSLLKLSSDVKMNILFGKKKKNK